MILFNYFNQTSQFSIQLVMFVVTVKFKGKLEHAKKWDPISKRQKRPAGSYLGWLVVPLTSRNSFKRLDPRDTHKRKQLCRLMIFSFSFFFFLSFKSAQRSNSFVTSSRQTRQASQPITNKKEFKQRLDH